MIDRYILTLRQDDFPLGLLNMMVEKQSFCIEISGKKLLGEQNGLISSYTKDCH